MSEHPIAIASVNNLVFACNILIAGVQYMSCIGVKVDVATINSSRLEVFSLSAKHTLKGYHMYNYALKSETCMH